MVARRSKNPPSSGTSAAKITYRFITVIPTFASIREPALVANVKVNGLPGKFNFPVKFEFDIRIERRRQRWQYGRANSLFAPGGKGIVESALAGSPL
ncbi:MAG: hypothetical protein KGJ00_18760, partial [Bradyrhizobium sp.]|nr:hypothetical protein [Bradyrhizobium sp.]